MSKLKEQTMGLPADRLRSKSRLGMQLISNGMPHNAAGFVLNAIVYCYYLGNDSADKNTVIEVTIAGTTVSIVIIGKPLSATLRERAADIFSIAKNDFYSGNEITYLLPLVYLSEYCLLDVSLRGILYRHMFVAGEAVGTPIVQQANPLGISIGFVLTLPDSLFDSPVLDQITLKRAVEFLQESPVFRRSGVDVPMLDYTWTQSSPYFHSVRIKRKE